MSTSVGWEGMVHRADERRAGWAGQVEL